MTDISRFRTYVAEMTRLVERAGGDEGAMIDGGKALLADLIAKDDWLPDAFAAPDPARYCQYLLHCDPLERFSVVSFVWGPGQDTPVHDHTVWGLIGVLRGAEIGQRYAIGRDGIEAGHEERLERGQIDVVSPTRGDVHRVANALKDRPSISIHVYGANIGAVRRHVFDAKTGAPKDFISGYSSAVVPNLWDRSRPAA
ncbi:MAG: cysteine dioxygenase [Rhodospirillaceae bacterium]